MTTPWRLWSLLALALFSVACDDDGGSKSPAADMAVAGDGGADGGDPGDGGLTDGGATPTWIPPATPAPRAAGA
ncbi:MAG: hypothetical protein R3F60_23145 [bacterium]